MLWVDLGWEGLRTSGPSRCLASAGRLLEVAVVNLGQPFDYHLQTVPLTFQECWLLSKVCCFYSLLSECPTPDRSLPSVFGLFVVVVVCLLTQTRVIREEEPRLLRKELSIRLFVGKSVGHFLDLIPAHCMVTVLETLAKKILHSPMGLLTVF